MTRIFIFRPSKNQKTLLFCFQVIIYIRNTEFHANDAIHPNTGIRGACRLTRRLHAAPGTPGTAVVGSRASYLWEIIIGSIPVDSLDTRGDEAAPIEPHCLTFFFHSRLVVQVSTWLIPVTAMGRDRAF